MLYSICETFPSSLQSLCDLPTSGSHLSGFPRDRKFLLFLRLHSLFNSLTLYLLQGQKQQQQPGKDSNLQGTQYSSSLGLMKRFSAEAISFFPQSICPAEIHRGTEILWEWCSKIPHWSGGSFRSHCLVFAVDLT